MKPVISERRYRVSRPEPGQLAAGQRCVNSAPWRGHPAHTLLIDGVQFKMVGAYWEGEIRISEYASDAHLEHVVGLTPFQVHELIDFHDLPIGDEITEDQE